MYNFSPKDYVCPICLGVQGVELDKTEVWVATPEERNVFSQPIKDYLKIHPVKPE